MGVYSRPDGGGKGMVHVLNHDYSSSILIITPDQ